MATDHRLQLSWTDLSECLWPLFGAAGFQPSTWGTQGSAPVFAGQLTIVTIELNCQMMHGDPERMSKDH